jgi:ABC-type sugar transport system ATPase subunit
LQLAEGAGVIVTSESEEELTEICDRVIILYHGKVVAELTRGERDFTAGELYRLIQGVVV